MSATSQAPALPRQGQPATVRADSLEITGLPPPGDRSHRDSVQHCLRSAREIGQAVGLSSASLARHLAVLERKDFLRYVPASQP